MRTRRRGKERRSTAQQQGSSQSASDDAMMTGAKDHNSLTDVSSYFQHTQSSDDDFEEEEFIPPQSKRSSLAGKLATLRSADSSTGKRLKKGTQPAKQRRSKRLRQEAAPQVERSSPSSPSERVMDSPIVQDEALPSVPPSKRLKQDQSNPPQPKERSSSTVSDTATGSPLVHHDGLDQDTSREDQAALYGKLDKMALPTQLVYLLTDDTSSWVEVLLEGRQWRSLHIPSLSLGQPQLCEKHCPRELSYVLAIDNGEWLR